MKAINNLIDTLEILQDAVRAKNESKGFEAVTIFLLQFVDTFGHSQDIVAKTFPVLEALKDSILSGEFEEAEVYVIALLARLRSVKKHMASS